MSSHRKPRIWDVVGLWSRFEMCLNTSAPNPTWVSQTHAHIPMLCLFFFSFLLQHSTNAVSPSWGIHLLQKCVRSRMYISSWWALCVPSSAVLLKSTQVNLTAQQTKYKKNQLKLLLPPSSVFLKCVQTGRRHRQDEPQKKTTSSCSGNVAAVVDSGLPCR